MNTILTMHHNQPIKTVKQKQYRLSVARSKDWLKLSVLHAEGFSQCLETAMHLINALMQSSKVVVWKLVDRNNNIIAMASTKCTNQAVNLSDLVVKSHFRNQGIGEIFTRKLMQKLRFMFNKKNIVLKVRANNKTAIALYKKLDFIVLKQSIENDSCQEKQILRKAS